jgi:O-antigen/teichoic acid export membrane protein
MSNSIRLPAFASFVGKLTYALSSLIALPLYIRFLGAESVGLFGFFTTLLMMFMAVEGGLCSSFTRELARNGRLQKIAPSRYAFRLCGVANTYFAAFLGLGIIVACIVFILSAPATKYWLEFNGLSESVVITAIRWMGVFIGLNFLVIIIQAGLLGREKQVTLNAAYIPYSLLRTLGALFFLFFLGENATVSSFFVFQCIVQVFYVLVLLFLFYVTIETSWWRFMPRLRYLTRGLRFGAGVLFISLTSVVVIQADKFYLSGTLSLGEYGVYTLAVTFASVPYIMSSALYAVLFPRFSFFMAGHRHAEVSSLFQSTFSWFTIILLPLVLLSLWFSSYPLTLIFNDIEIINGISHLLPVLLAGTAIQALLIVPFALQLSVGWTSLVLRLNLFALPIILIVLPFAVKLFGPIGAALVWLLYNVISFFVIMSFMIKRFPFIRRGFWSFCEVSLSHFILLLIIFFLLKNFFLNSLDPVFAILIIGMSTLICVLVTSWVFRKRLTEFS